MSNHAGHQGCEEYDANAWSAQLRQVDEATLPGKTIACFGSMLQLPVWSAQLHRVDEASLARKVNAWF